MAIPFGFHRLTDKFSQLASANLQEVNDAVAASLRVHDEATRALGIFSFQTPIATQAYVNPIESSELQPLDEHARALVELSVRPDRYTVGLPLYAAGTAIGETFMVRRRQTVEGVANALANALLADDNWRVRQFYTGLFQAADYTYFDEGGVGDAIVKPLANGDAIRYAVNTSAGAKTDNHLLGQAAAISDAANPLPNLANTIREHPDNTGDILIYCSDAQAVTIRALALFYPIADPNITAALTNARLSGTAPSTPVGTVIGYVGGDTRAWIVIWPRLNSVGTGQYLIAVSTGGNRPLAERVDPAIPGFGLADERNNYPYYERQYIRVAGFGAWNRTAAAILQIGSATYAVPVGFAREN